MKHLFVLALAVSAVATPLCAQTITVRLLDGKSGKPITDKNITFHWNSDHFEESVVRIGKDGVGKVTAPAKATDFFLMEGPKDGDEPFRVAYFDCNTPAHSRNSISEVLSRGIVPGNECSKRSAKAEPGVIIFWGLTRRWYEPDMQ